MPLTRPSRNCAFLARFFPQNQKLQPARTISTPVLRLTARLAGRSKAGAHQNDTGFQKGQLSHFAYFNRKKKLNYF
jgi:hypothetical protein